MSRHGLYFGSAIEPKRGLLGRVVAAIVWLMVGVGLGLWLGATRLLNDVPRFGS